MADVLFFRKNSRKQWITQPVPEVVTTDKATEKQKIMLGRIKTEGFRQLRPGEVVETTDKKGNKIKYTGKELKVKSEYKKQDNKETIQEEKTELL